MIPPTGSVEIPCGFAAERIFLLGCTVAEGRPLEVAGSIEIVYRDGPSQRFPLMRGFTLDEDLKLLSRSKAMYLHPSGDPFQHYLVLAPRPGVIETIRLDRNPKSQAVPRITAITCQTSASSENLEDLPDSTIDAEEAAWIASHAISADRPKMAQIVAEIRRAHKIPDR